MAREINLENYLNSLDKTYFLTFVQNWQKNPLITEVYQKILKLFPHINVQLSMEKHVQNIGKAELKSGKQIFVFDNFEKGNSTQKYVSSAKIFGLSLMSKLTMGKIVIFDDSNCVFGTQFKGMVLCASNITPSQKKEIEEMIVALNGKFTYDLTDDTTHLITNTTKTMKYVEATKKSIPVYHVDWIKKVFADASNASDVAADNESYSRYILPPLFDLKITTTGVPVTEREALKIEIEGHGGSFEESFRKDAVDILIVGNNTFNEKYKIAKSLKVPCLSDEWIHDSIKAQHALSYEKYSVSQAKKKEEPKTVEKLKEETAKAPDDDDNNSLSTQKTQHTNPNDEKIAVNGIPLDLSEDLLACTERSKKIAQIFDGMRFNIFDFSFAHSMKLKKILMECGGWCTDVNEEVTHIICCSEDDPTSQFDNLTKVIQENNWHPTLVKFKWITECIDKGKLLPMKEFIIRDFAATSHHQNHTDSSIRSQENNGMIMPSKFHSNAKPLEVSNNNKTTSNPVPKRKISKPTVPARKPKRLKLARETVWDQI